jgi:integrase
MILSRLLGSKRLSALMTYAVDDGIVEHNVVRGVPRQADKKRTRRLTPDEFKTLGVALREAENRGAPWQVIVGIQLLALTGCRLGEIVNLRWPEIDTVNQCVRLEDTKEGPSIRPIGQAALAILSQKPLLEHVTQGRNDPYVLPATRRSGSFGGLPKALRKFMKQAGLEGVTAHTLRHSFASVAGDLGYADATIASLLGHAGGTVTSRYIHVLDSVLVAAADRVTERINDWIS